MDKGVVRKKAAIVQGICMWLKSRNRKNAGFSNLNGLSLERYSLAKNGYAWLQRLGITVSYGDARQKSKILAKSYDAKLVRWTQTVRATWTAMLQKGDGRHFL